MKTLKDFATKKEFFQYLVKNKAAFINEKKSALKFSDPFVIDSIERPVTKTLNTSYKDAPETGMIKRDIIGNTYLWMDSHDDVHLLNCFAKSIADAETPASHFHDHIQQLTAKVGEPVNIYEKLVSWSDLGVNSPGQTMCLIMESEILKDYDAKIFNMYLAKRIKQHSVGMRYVNISLAVNDPDEQEEYATWLKYIGVIGNKEKVMEQGYFYAVAEANLIEISCVYAGSNTLTGTVDNKEVIEETQVEKSFFEKMVQINN